MHCEQGCGRLEQGALALLVHNEMEVYKIGLTPTLLNLLLDALFRGRYFDRVEETFFQYSSRTRPNRITYNILFKAICQGRNDRKVSSETKSVTPLTSSGRSEESHAKSEFTEKVQVLLNEMESRGIRIADDTWCTILDGCQSDVPLCLELFSRLSNTSQRMQRDKKVIWVN